MSDGIRKSARVLAVGALTLALAGWADSAARTEVIPGSQMEQGTRVSESECAMRTSTVWVRVGNYGFCVRYYVSMEGGAGPVPVVFLSGDRLGNFNRRTRRFISTRPGESTDVKVKDLQGRANVISRLSRTTAIYLARIGIDGSSGFHGERRSWLELYALNAALNLIKQRHGYRGFHLVGQSGGAGMIGGLLALRADIGCAVPGAGPLAYFDRKGRPTGRQHLLSKVDPVEHIKSILRNNIFGLQARHNASFWQETDNPRLGSSDNKIVQNLFISTGRLAVQFINHSTRNEFANNILLGVQMSGGRVIGNPAAVLMEVDGTVGANVYRSNFYASGKINGRYAVAGEIVRPDFSPTWFANFPAALNHNPNDFTPAARAPFLGLGAFSPHAPADRNGKMRQGQVDLGPIEAR